VLLQWSGAAAPHEPVALPQQSGPE
jgi:hypothetical protein